MAYRHRGDARSSAARAWRGWYSTSAWRSIRARRLFAEPLCRFCARLGLTVAATVVDHVKPHRGDRVLFFDFDNTQSLCATCHDTAKQRDEARGYVAGVDASGFPLSEDHPWRIARERLK